MEKNKLMIITIIILIFAGIATYFYIDYKTEQKQQQAIAEQKKKEKKLLDTIESHYNEYVKANKEATLYEFLDNKYLEIGKINKDVEMKLIKEDITINTKYFKISDLNYYINYEDVNKIELITNYNTRYKNYIPFNQNIITKDKTNFYNNNELVYSINKSFNLPILAKENNKYYIEYNNQFLYVLKDDVSEVINNHNANEAVSNRMAVFNYHGFYDPKLDNNCNTVICLTTEKFEQQLKYITDNNFLTVTMWEFERYIEGNLRLPVKSVLLTIDDGGPGVTTRAMPLLTKYNQMATLFLITSWFDPKVFQSNNLELHSHGHNLHNQYECPGYGEQGGAIMCKDKQYLLNDLNKSRELLNNTTAFAYPFYDFNEYSISVLKEAGFTIAFRGGYIKANVGVDKFRVPRFTVMSYLTLERFKELIN
ncbi:MAG: polysaccharide deacetylase family protein [Bacilli bacterium]|nr:polysaccharide deacetylase family protein [Bacilli bacterium]MDD4808777.1 polysaccharide deacetylase family protein [Bacilli bacterium]